MLRTTSAQSTRHTQGLSQASTDNLNIPEPKILGLKEGAGRNRLTIDLTKNPHPLDSSTCVLCEHPHSYLSHFKTEAGWHILVSAILLHLVVSVKVDVPDFRIDATRFEYASTSFGYKILIQI